MIKTGIYGGTFNPPHLGHVLAAESFSRAISPDEFLIIPDFLPPHKDFVGNVSPEDRIEMCRLAFSHIENVSVSDIEIKRGGRSYTAITLAELSRADRELYFLCGTDMFVSMDEWFHPEEIFKYAVICVVRRESDSLMTSLIDECKKRYIEKYGARVVLIDSNVKEISSTDSRTNLKNGISALEYIPKSVNDYILAKGLYR